MRENIDTPAYELSETELDSVSGGFFDFGNTVTQTNNAIQVGVNALTLLGGVAQVLAQSNESNI